MLEDFFY